MVVNDRTGEVIHVSDKNDPDWTIDDRIEWDDDADRESNSNMDEDTGDLNGDG